MNMDYVDYENGGEHYEDEDYGVYYEDPYEHQQEIGFTIIFELLTCLFAKPIERTSFTTMVHLYRRLARQSYPIKSALIHLDLLDPWALLA